MVCVRFVVAEAQVLEIISGRGGDTLIAAGMFWYMHLTILMPDRTDAFESIAL